MIRYLHRPIFSRNELLCVWAWAKSPQGEAIRETKLTVMSSSGKNRSLEPVLFSELNQFIRPDWTVWSSLYLKVKTRVQKHILEFKNIKLITNIRRPLCLKRGVHKTTDRLWIWSSLGFMTTVIKCLSLNYDIFNANMK